MSPLKPTVSLVLKTGCVQYVCPGAQLKAVDVFPKPCRAPPAAQCSMPAVTPLLCSHMSPLPESEAWKQFRIHFESFLLCQYTTIMPPF